MAERQSDAVWQASGHGTASGSTTLHDAAAAAGAHVADTWIVPGAGHTDAIYKDPRGYEQRLAAFFGEALGEAAG